MEYKGLKLDKFQEDAIAAIEKNHSVVVSAPTGSGKTLIADYIINRDLDKGIRVIYTAPIKALSNQKYKEFCKDYGKQNVGLITGDIVINHDAPILIMTTEVYRNMVLVEDKIIQTVSYVVFDEIHFLSDIERGYVWEESIIFSNPTIRFLCLSATIPNSEEFADWIRTIKKHEVDVVRHEVRNVPLHKAFFDSELDIATLEQIKEIIEIPTYEKGMSHGKGKHGRAPRAKPPSHIELIKQIMDKLPCFFFSFSREKCQVNSLELSKTRLFPVNAKIISIIREKLSDSPPEIHNLRSTRMLKETLPYGIGFHHAGLIPVLKDLVEDLFGQGLIKVLYTTETFAVGINMPAKTVCFESLRKFDGINFRFLNSKEYFQIAGRAGRRGIDKEGFAYAMIDRRDFDYKLLRKITLKDVDPIKSQFKLSVNTVLNLIKRHKKEEIGKILAMNFHTFQKHGKWYAQLNDTVHHNFDNMKKKLIKMEYLEPDGDKLTYKGEFGARIYADEILFTEIFATDFYKDLNEYQLLLLIASLCYESREKIEFFAEFKSREVEELIAKIQRDDYLRFEKRFKEIRSLTALIHPIHKEQSIFDFLKNSNIPEGDLLRFFRQILDRLNQLKDATGDRPLRNLIEKCQYQINISLKGMDEI